MTLSKLADRVITTALPIVCVLKVSTALPSGTIVPILTAAAPTVIYFGTSTILVYVLDTKVGIPKSITSPIAIVCVTAVVAPEIIIISAGCGASAGLYQISQIISSKFPSREEVEEIKEIIQQKTLLACKSFPSREEVIDAFESSKSTITAVYEYVPSRENVGDLFEAAKSTLASVYEYIPSQENMSGVFEASKTTLASIYEYIPSLKKL